MGEGESHGILLLYNFKKYVRSKTDVMAMSNRLNRIKLSHSLPPLSLTQSREFLLLLKEVGSARLRESYIHTISPKTPVPHYQPIDRKKRKGKIVEDYSRDRAV